MQLIDCVQIMIEKYHIIDIVYFNAFITNQNNLKTLTDNYVCGDL